MLNEVPQSLNITAIRNRLSLWIPFFKINVSCTLRI
uniref:Putative ADP-ribosylation factor GTPase-activating protein AGD14 isoform X1 n=1 Tax=Rhizophora mucronata TaxID=61149 RepID=A0A2P2M5E9_RHIMU